MSVHHGTSCIHRCLHEADALFTIATCMPGHCRQVFAYPLCAAHNCQPKVADLEGAIAVAEDIVRLDVHDNHFVRMQELQPLCNLPEHLPHDSFKQQLSLLLSLQHMQATASALDTVVLPLFMQS